MKKLSTKGNRAYPAIPAIHEDIQSLSMAVRQIKEALETHERRNANYLNSFVRFQELIDLGLIDKDGNPL